MNHPLNNMGFPAACKNRNKLTSYFSQANVTVPQHAWGPDFLPIYVGPSFRLASTHVGCNTHLRVKKASLVSWLTVYCKKGAYLSHTRVLKHNLCQGCNPNFCLRFNDGKLGLFWVKKPHSEAEVASEWPSISILGWGIRIFCENWAKIITLSKNVIFGAPIEHFLPFLGKKTTK